MTPDPAALLSEVMAAINTYDPLIFTDQHRDLFERAAVAGEVTVQVREEWGVHWHSAIGDYESYSPSRAIAEQDITHAGIKGDLLHRTVTTYTSPWTPVEDGERT